MADDPYDVGTTIGKVRFYIPDTSPVPQPQLDGAKAFMFSDDELQMLLDRNSGSVLLAAADACMVFGTNEMMVGKVITTQDQVTDTSKLMAQYRANAESLRAQATALGEGPVGIDVGAGIDVVDINGSGYCYPPVTGTFLPISAVGVPPQTVTVYVEDESMNNLIKILSTKLPDSVIAGSIVRNSDNTITSAGVIWEDGTTGTYTALTLSTAFPGAVDSYKVTYNGSPVLTYTQPLITRDASGNPTTIPAIVVT